MIFLAIDYGTKRIGLAACDELEFGAYPLATVTRSRSLRHDLGEILRIGALEQVQAFVVGLPLNADGSHGPSAQAATEFSRALSKLTGLPITMHNEYGTTMDAADIMIEADISRSKRREKIDQMAAASILRSFLRHRADEKRKGQAMHTESPADEPAT
ncbi:MAG: Holliday junction resolvase RuvX [Akkermansiaceae bacterium]|nr:Holliday junction resolvase RuvX [Armatimonadota bacterium]